MSAKSISQRSLAGGAQPQKADHLERVPRQGSAYEFVVALGKDTDAAAIHGRFRHIPLHSPSDAADKRQASGAYGV